MGLLPEDADILPPYDDRIYFLNTFSLRHDIDNGLLSDAIHVIYVELSKLQDILNKSIEEMTDLEKWAVFLRRL